MKTFAVTLKTDIVISIDDQVLARAQDQSWREEQGYLDLEEVLAALAQGIGADGYELSDLEGFDGLPDELVQVGEVWTETESIGELC